ncbi:MAG: glycosyltransferase involved in cell wall biosynthesis [Sphingobacteriales bacterium]|jgi:glycosyltransferase involved in cell wall biosynthesis
MGIFKPRKRLLIIGKIPPPLGGVTIHVKRLLEVLKIKGVPFEFFNLSFDSVYKLLFIVPRCKVVHNHSNHRLFLCLVTFWCLIIRTKSIITIHGNTQSIGGISNFFERLALKYCTLPILLNKNSLNFSLPFNKNAKLLSAFIAPNNEIGLKPSLSNCITDLKKKTNKLYCTNASSFAYDSSDQEIYSINLLIKLFTCQPNMGLIISDPSKEYQKYFQRNKVNLPKNVILISEIHSFYRVIEMSNVLLRITTTDGDSISIREAQFLGKPVIATDVVERPDFVRLVSFDQINAIFEPEESESFHHFENDCVESLISIYLELES